METVFYVVVAVVVTIACMSALNVVVKARKAGDKNVPWEKIRPILTETFIRIKEVNDLKKVGYQAMEDYAVLLVQEQVAKAGFLNDAERSLITDDLIRSIVGPRLKEIYEEKDGK